MSRPPTLTSAFLRLILLSRSVSSKAAVAETSEATVVEHFVESENVAIDALSVLD